jgi:Dockerin type I domain
VVLPRGRVLRHLVAGGVATIALLVHFSLAGQLFRANSQPQSGSQNPRIASDAHGGFVVVWTRAGAYPGVNARIYGGDGIPIAPEFRVDPMPSRDHVNPAVAASDSGDFVVVWEGIDLDGGYIEARRFTASGVPLGSAFHVNGAERSYEPSVASDAMGNFVIAWTGVNVGGFSFAFARLFAADGAALGPEFRVSASTANSALNEAFPSVSRSRTSGDFVIAWTNWYLTDGLRFNRYGRRFSALGEPLGSDFEVMTSSARGVAGVSVSMDARGEYVIAWSERGYGLARIYEASGIPFGPAFRINSDSSGIDFGPSVAASSTGGFVVTWQENAPGFPHLAQRFDEGGRFVGARLTVGYPAVSGPPPAISSDPSGNFVVVWRQLETSDPAGPDDIFGRRYRVEAPGDVNGDGLTNIIDIFDLIDYLFAGGVVPPWLAAADANGDGVVDVADIFYLINYLFAGGPAPI